jgi:hypothetical protein
MLNDIGCKNCSTLLFYADGRLVGEASRFPRNTEQNKVRLMRCKIRTDIPYVGNWYNFSVDQSGITVLKMGAVILHVERLRA